MIRKRFLQFVFKVAKIFDPGPERFVAEIDQQCGEDVIKEEQRFQFSVISFQFFRNGTKIETRSALF